jgi:cytochrome c oxidase subunit 1
LINGRQAPANPWGGATLEWRCTSPPPFYNFERAPTVGDPYEFRDLFWDAEHERYVTLEPEREVVPSEEPAEVPAKASDGQ